MKSNAIEKVLYVLPKCLGQFPENTPQKAPSRSKWRLSLRSASPEWQLRIGRPRTAIRSQERSLAGSKLQVAAVPLAEGLPRRKWFHVAPRMAIAMAKVSFATAIVDRGRWISTVICETLHKSVGRRNPENFADHAGLCRDAPGDGLGFPKTSCQRAWETPGSYKDAARELPGIVG